MDSSIIYRILLIFLFLISPAHTIEFQGKFLQGHYILGKTNPKATIFVGKKEVKVSKDGDFVFGIDRDQKYDLTFTEIVEGRKITITKKVLKRKYNIQRIDGLAESKVTPPESVYKRIKKENNAIGEARAINSNLQFFKEKFIMPVEGIISGVYGSQRILNGKPRWPHYGIDIAAKQGTIIKSSASGVITMGLPRRNVCSKSGGLKPYAVFQNRQHHICKAAAVSSPRSSIGACRHQHSMLARRLG